jgi:pre-mRNA-processing factor 6
VQARHRNPKTPELWLAAIRTEQRAGSTKAAEALLAKGLQDCPNAGLLWAEAVAMAPRPQRRTKAADAMKRCDNDPFVVSCWVGALQLNLCSLQDRP